MGELVNDCTHNKETTDIARKSTSGLLLVNTNIN